MPDRQKSNLVTVVVKKLRVPKEKAQPPDPRLTPQAIRSSNPRRSPATQNGSHTDEASTAD